MMVRTNAKTAEEYLQGFPPDRREALEIVRQVILENLPAGYDECINWGMLSYEIPLERYPKTYNNQPLSYVALASWKHYMSVYLNGVYSDPQIAAWFTQRYEDSGKRLNMGKSCVRFKKADDLPLDLIGETVAKFSVENYIQLYESSRKEIP